MQAVETLQSNGDLSSLSSDRFNFSHSQETDVYMLTAKSSAGNVQVMAAITIDDSGEVTYISYIISSATTEDGGGT